ncbi:MAG: hypothetical protein JNJ57_00005, partial [Saprospiraceae bacterium]|nr:hypothetical protein [Saprospiraceae bacterium]
MKTILCFLLALVCHLPFAAGQKPKLGLPIGHHDYIANLLVSNDGKYLLTGDRGSMKLWDIKTGKLLRSNNKRGATFYIQLDATAEHVLFVDGITDVWQLVWDIEKESITQVEG